MTIETPPSSTGISVLLADSKQMESQLLAGSLRHRGFEFFLAAAKFLPLWISFRAGAQMSS